MNKGNIVSSFYLIRVDRQPAYVGYTNRDVKKRFAEHMRDKDFDSEDVTVEKIDELVFPFSWDLPVINEYAKQVSERETELIAGFGTADCEFQKGLYGNVGGQTWADVKSFVRTNKNSPVYTGLSEEVVLEVLDNWGESYHFLTNSTNYHNPSLENFIKNGIARNKPSLESFIRLGNTGNETGLEGFIKNSADRNNHQLEQFIRGAGSHNQDDLERFVKGNIKHTQAKLENVVQKSIDGSKPNLEQFIKSSSSHNQPKLERFVKRNIGNNR